jgi:hypothetical protein
VERVLEFEPVESDTDTDTDTEPIERQPCELTLVSPDFGTTLGGNEVTIEVSPEVGQDPVVFFGEQLAEVLDEDAKSVDVRVPSQALEGSFSVSLESVHYECSTDDAYHYWLDGNGRQGAFGSLNWYSFQGGYWADGTPYGTGSFGFVRPTDFIFAEMYSPVIDTCESEYLPNHGLEYYNIGGMANLATSAKTVTFEWDSGENYYETKLESGDLTTQTEYQLEPIKGYPPWPEFGVGGFVSTPAAFSITSPGVGGSAMPVWWSTTMDLEWDSSLPGDYVVLEIHRVVSEVDVETVTCVMVDDGVFTIPLDAFYDWQYGDQYLLLYLGRVRQSTVLLPHNQARSGVAGVYWTVGAVWTPYW